MFLLKRGLLRFTYLDDWLLLASSESLLLEHMQLFLQTMQNLDLLFYWEKLELSPTRTPVYLGAEFEFPKQLARPSVDSD